MEHLWAPWRNAYVTAEDKGGTAELFRTIGQGEDDSAHFVFFRSKSVFVLLNRYPYNAGHSLVVPYREVSELQELSGGEQKDLWDTVNTTVALLKATLSPHGFNIGINIGEAAGAGIPHHIHVHVVPRWKNDVNFMTTQAQTRIHPAELETIYSRLVACRKNTSPHPSH